MPCGAHSCAPVSKLWLTQVPMPGTLSLLFSVHKALLEA